jgi:hypothetical protein
MSSMRKTWIAAVACVLGGPAYLQAAHATSILVGVNVVAVDQMNPTQQDALLVELEKKGVTVIRTTLGGKNDGYTHFVIKASQHGIRSIVMLSPNKGGSDAHTARPNSLAGRGWAMTALSDADPEGFRRGYSPVLASLDAAGVHLAAFELGNEINMTWDNADFPVPNSGRVLGIKDLENPNDPEARSVAEGFKAYVKIMATLKDLRDHLKVNKTTPVILGGLGNVGLPGPQSFNKQLQVAIPDTIEFLRKNGLDQFADGYGVHVYPNGNTREPMAQRIADLDTNIFAQCRKATKPCWLTEWGFDNRSTFCPIDESVRLRQLQAQRTAFAHFIQQGRLAASIYYSWSGLPGEKDNSGAIFRCGALTDAGKLALAPF